MTCQVRAVWFFGNSTFVVARCTFDTFFFQFLFRWRLASTLDSLATATSLLKARICHGNHHKTTAMIGKPRLRRGSGKALKTTPGSGTLYVLYVLLSLKQTLGFDTFSTHRSVSVKMARWAISVGR